MLKWYAHILPLHCDKLSTLNFLGFDTLIATGHSNKVSITLFIQENSQLMPNSANMLGDIVLNICGNVIVEQANPEQAKQVSIRSPRQNNPGQGEYSY